MTSQILQALFSLIFVIVLIFVLAYLYKKIYWSRVSNHHLIKNVAMLPVGSKEKIALIQCHNQQFLVGITSQKISLLHSFDKGSPE